MQASPLDLNDSNMPRFEWPLLSPSTDTTALLSPSKEKQLTDRIRNLELMVSNLLASSSDDEESFNLHKFYTVFFFRIIIISIISFCREGPTLLHGTGLTCLYFTHF